MVPAADFPHEMAINFFTNICPQAPLLNRGLWNRLEQYVRKLASQCDTIVVISGPLWLPERKLQEELFEYRYVGLGQPPSLVSVPTHFFKLIVVFDTSQQHIQEYAAFVIPNQNESSGRAADYLVRWSDLESVVGMRFFARLATNEQDWKVQADAAADKLLQEPSSQQLLLEARRNKNNKRQSVLPRGPDHLCRSSRCNF
jgi:DNA/RNA endonuclease G (NUC1)